MHRPEGGPAGACPGGDAHQAHGPCDATPEGKTAYHLFRVFPELRAMFMKGHLWSRGKFFRSVGAVTDEVIEHYILESRGGQRRPRPSIQESPRTAGMVLRTLGTPRREFELSSDHLLVSSCSANHLQILSRIGTFWLVVFRRTFIFGKSAL